ncbi:MAG: RDD family protein [Candidatus Sumerlaeota bacterium]|nr:RDD family protein [Candidatus Sumerlaeota bacterium]
MPEIEINPPLDPKKIKDWIPPERREGKGEAEGEGGPVLASFFARAVAFLVDMLALYLVAYGANLQFRDPLLRLGGAAPLLAAAVCLAYFSLAEGPVGQGRSIGKYLLQIRVVDRRGRTLDGRMALARAAVKTAPLLGYLSLQPSAMRGDLLADDTAALFAYQIVFEALVGLLLANALLVAIDSRRRSLQDLATDAAVVKALAAPKDVEAQLEDMKKSARPRPAWQWAALAVVLAAPGALFVTDFVKSSGSQIHARLAAKDRALREIIGSREYIAGRGMEVSPAPAPASGPVSAPVSAPASAPSEPRSFRFILDFVKFGKISTDEVARLKTLSQRLPALRAWFIDFALDAMTPESLARFRGEGFRKGELDVRFSERLDVGFSFSGPPVVQFEDRLTTDDLRLLGVLGASASAPSGKAKSERKFSRTKSE